MDDEFALQLNIGCIILILISFFWMIQHDYHEQKLSRDPKKRRQLVVVLASTSSTRPELDAPVEKLSQIIQSQHFQVRTIQIAGRNGVGEAEEHQQELTTGSSVLEVNSSSKSVQMQIEQLVREFKLQLDEQDLKFHAYIDLGQFEVVGGAAAGPFDPDQCKQVSSAANLLLFAIKKLMLDHGTRLVVVSDDRHLKRARCWSSSSSSKFKLERFVHETLEQLAGRKEVKVDRSQLVGIPLAEIRLTSEKRVSLKERLFDGMFAVLMWGEESTYTSETQTVAERHSLDSDTLDQKLNETILELVQSLRPYEAKITL